MGLTTDSSTTCEHTLNLKGEGALSFKMQVLLFMSQPQLSALLYLGIKEYKAAKKPQ